MCRMWIRVVDGLVGTDRVQVPCAALQSGVLFRLAEGETVPVDALLVCCSSPQASAARPTAPLGKTAW